jgi:hypothetical protein
MLWTPMGRATLRAMIAALAATAGLLAANGGSAHASTAPAALIAAAVPTGASAHADVTAPRAASLATPSAQPGRPGPDAASVPGRQNLLRPESLDGSYGPGGGFTQDVTVPGGDGISYVATAWLSAVSGTSTGQLCLSATCRQYSVSAGTASWVQVVYDATGFTNSLAFQLDVSGGTTDMSNASLVPSMLTSGSFEGSSTGWAKWVPSGATVNMALYNTAHDAPAAAQDGRGYLAFNSNSAGGGVYQDVAAGAGLGASYVATAWLSAQSGTATGELCLWGLGSQDTDNCTSYSVTAGTYTPVQVVYEVPIDINTLRFQFYATPNGGTTDLDTASLAPDLLVSGSFEWSSYGWAETELYNTTVNMALYNTADGAPAAAHDGDGYLAFNTSQAGGGVDHYYFSSAAGESYVATAWLSAQSGTTSGELCLWDLGSSNPQSCQTYSVTAGTYTPVQVVYDNTSDSTLCLEIDPTPNAGTTDMDTVSLVTSPPIDAG